MLTSDLYQIKRIPEKSVQLVNGINTYLFVLLALLLFFFRFELSGNEEHYMHLAKQFYDPDWVPGSFTYTEFPGTRIAYQYLIGFLLHYWPFEFVAGLGRLLLSVLIAIPLAKLYRLLGVSNIFILLHLTILYLGQGLIAVFNQSFFGDEWIFLSVEPKCFAYVFVLYALYFLLVEKFALVSVNLAAASYFHLLVGGWVMLYFSLYHLVAKKTFKKPFFNGLLFLLCMIPLILYLAPVFGENFSGSEAAKKADWIFTFFKQPYHTAIFLDLKYFIRASFEGVMKSLFFFLMCVFVFVKYREKYNQRLNLLNELIFIGAFLSVILAYFDHTGAFVKYFPFRINALYAFMVMLQLTLFLQFFVFKEGMLKYVQFGLLMWFLLFTTPRQAWYLVENQYRYWAGRPVNPAYEETCRYIKEHTPADAVILYLPQYIDPDYLQTMDGGHDMVRKTKRDRYIYFFFAPISPDADKTIEWYRRVQWKKSVIEDRKTLCQRLGTEKVDYILSDFALEEGNCYSLIYQKEPYYLFERRDYALPD